ncbi:MAG: hypothetical protein AUK47_02230 [Deltaproteobacteria bacterium CG2_30_63_29]|nr:MAG: hypothetical protein AUK47_02230 [Deltaproteobacteria bacterium CG2_30_63_29]
MNTDITSEKKPTTWSLLVKRLKDMPWRAAGRREGMTLIEIMIVVTIMAAIMGVVGWFVIGQSQKANIELTKTQLKNLKGAVEAYRLQYLKYPESLDDLVKTPDGFKLIEEVPTDPWGEALTLEKTGKSVTITSAGPDNVPNNEDDISVSITE